ncbi:uncharacterized protein LOC107981176 [Nasonia vitripennis]|uniref:Uncharacterized protein n=1 Tax=Nasonia vitripennis TaxID=7425 RepID=A0A7M7J4S9_NASVI|nr:uncharacterized protein LOC107981176 [Nasonia vitripennis]
MDKIVDPDTASEILELMKKPAKRSRMSLQDAVKLIVNCNLSIYTYKISRKITLKYGHDLYPTYKEVAKFREESYPKDLVVTETKCVVRLQKLLNNTSGYLCFYIYLFMIKRIQLYY